MITEKRGFCPFRVAKPGFQAGCVLQLGDSFCYTRDQRPLIQRETDDTKNHYYTCPLVTKLRLSQETYQEIDQIVSQILIVQDEHELTMNLWPIFCRDSKITFPTRELVTDKGKEISHLSKRVREELQEIVLNLT
ncbi:MAG: hypothetical protein JSW11_11260 [Candidatus Heimdallarchaeota archaeon]|nr:MAG: hypothetical protein JSW11_11260 [Candidatus Heimdallarchaeota archaeon]